MAAYQVDFGIISKKTNSTSEGFTVNFSAACLLKIPCDVYNPTFLVQGEFPPTNNYFHVAAFGRYYWITAAKFTGGQWEITGETDVLASFKGYIGSQNQFIVRGSAARNGDIIDSYAIAKVAPTITRLSDALGLDAAGSYVVCCAGSSGNKFYMMGEANWRQLCAQIFSSGFLQADFNFWQAITQDFFNTLLDPQQYIINAKWIPAPVTGTQEAISLGLYTTGIAGYVVPPGSIIFSRQFTWAIPLHPQSPTYGSFLNGNAYRKISLALPGYGNIVLDADALATSATLVVTAEMDITGVLTYSIDYANIHTYVACDLSTDAGYNNTQLGLSNALAAVPQGAAGAISGGAAGAALGAAGGIVSAISSLMPQVERASSGGSRSALVAGQLVICTVVFYTIQDYSAERIGAPICVTAPPANYPGYLLCDHASVSCPGTEQEIQKINDYLNGGFYYE